MTAPTSPPGSPLPIDGLEISHSGSEVLLIEAKEWFEAGRKMIDARKERIVIMLTYLSVLIAGVAQDASNLTATLAGKILMTASMGLIVAAAVVLITAIVITSPSLPSHSNWFSHLSSGPQDPDALRLRLVEAYSHAARDTEVMFQRRRIWVLASYALTGAATLGVLIGFIVRFWA